MKIRRFFKIIKKKTQVLGIKDIKASEEDAASIAQMIYDLKKGDNEKEKTLVFDACIPQNVGAYVYFDERGARKKHKRRIC